MKEENVSDTTLVSIMTGNFSEMVTISEKVGTIVELILTFPSILLNFLIFLGICSISRLHTTPNVFIASLAVSNMSFACTNIGCSLVGLHRQRPDNQTLACVKSFILIFSLFSSHCYHLIISVERWLYITRPFLHQRIVTQRSTSCCVFSVWVIAGAASGNILIHCKSDFFINGIDIGLIDPCIHFVLSLTLFLIYFHIARITQRQVQAIHKMNSAVKYLSKMKTDSMLTILRKKWNIIRMLVIVTGTYFILLTPQICVNLYVYINCDLDIFQTTLFQCVRILSLLHSYCTFLVYARQDKDFKRALQHYSSKLGCHFSQNKVDTLT